jgi:hypothetical protein
VGYDTTMILKIDFKHALRRKRGKDAQYEKAVNHKTGRDTGWKTPRSRPQRYNATKH